MGPFFLNYEFHELNELSINQKTMPKLTLNYACIVDVVQVEPKPTDNNQKNRKVILHVDEEDLFDMFDQLNPKNIIKYLDMRGIPHREPANITVKVKPDASGLKLRHSLRRVGQELKRVREGRYGENKD